MSEPVITLRDFFTRARGGQLTGVRCKKCGELAIPPKELCPACHERTWEPVPLAGEGMIASYTVIRVAPRAYAADAPYAVAAVRLTEGVSLLGRVVDIPLERLAVGLPVRFRPIVRGEQTAIGFGPPEPQPSSSSTVSASSGNASGPTRSPRPSTRASE